MVTDEHILPGERPLLAGAYRSRLGASPAEPSVAGTPALHLFAAPFRGGSEATQTEPGARFCAAHLRCTRPSLLGAPLRPPEDLPVTLGGNPPTVKMQGSLLIQNHGLVFIFKEARRLVLLRKDKVIWPEKYRERSSDNTEQPRRGSPRARRRPAHLGACDHQVDAGVLPVPFLGRRKGKTFQHG